MALRLKLLLLIIGLPAIAAAIAVACLRATPARWTGAIERARWIEGAATPTPSTGGVDALSVEAPCAGADVPLANCTLRPAAMRVLWVTAGISIAGLAMIGGIVIIGRRCDGNRDRLIAIFQPAMWVTLVGACALLLANAALAVMMLLLIADLTGKIWPGGFLLIAIGTIGGIVGIVKAMRQVFRPASTEVLGMVASRDAMAGLLQTVREVARKLRALPPDHIVVGLSPSFFVTQATVVCPSGELTGRTLYLSLPLCRILSVSELTSIIGHELAHFTGADTAYGVRFNLIYRGAVNAMLALDRPAPLVSAVVRYPALALCRFFIEAFHEAEAAIGRERELRADQEAARVTDASTAATALVRGHVFSEQWPQVLDEIQRALPAGFGDVNLSEMFAQRVQAMKRTPELLEGVLDGHLPHPTDSHPTLAARLASFHVSLDQLQDEVLAMPAQPAITLFNGIESAELTLSHILRARYDEYRLSMQRVVHTS
jgi:Zn-dependent protease with chaperone function